MPDDNEKRLSGPSMDDDDFSGLYMLSRQVAEEWHGPAMSALRRHSMPENDGLVRARGKDGKMPGADLKPSASHQVEKIRRGDAPLEDPWIDPVMAGTAGFGAAAKIGLSTGMKLMPSLGRAITAGVVSAGADVPVGAATEQVAGDSAAAPFVNLLFGAASGVGVERALEDTIMRLAGGSGARSAAKLIGNVKAELLSGEVKSAVGKQVENEISLVRKAVESGETVDSPWYEPVKKILQSEEGAVYLEMSGKKVPGSGVPAKEGMQKAGQAVAAAKPERLPKYAGNVNLSNIADETGDSLKQLIFATSKELSPELKKARRGVRSWAKTEAASRSYSLQDLLGRKIGEAYNAEQIENARSTLITSASNLKYYRDKILSKEATDADKFEFQKAFNLHYAIQSQVAGAAAEAGRALQVFRKLATEDSVRLKEMDEMMQAMGRAKDPETLARLMESFDDAAQIGKFVEQAQRATSTDMLLEAWINGLLSGPQTHAVNMTSNALVALWQVPERFLASQISRVTPGARSIAEGEVGSQIYGLFRGSIDGLRAFGKTVKTGEPADALSKLEARKYRAITAENVKQLPVIQKLAPNSLESGGVAARAVDLLGEGVRLPGRFLQAEDELWKGIGYRMELHARAYRQAKEEGLAGEAFATRMQEIIEDPQNKAPDIHLAAVDAARYQTFTRPLGEAGQAYQGIVNKVPALRLITPFVRTPVNIMKFGFERTPLAPLMSSFREDVAAGGARRDMALARASLGSVVMTATAVLAASGYITGNGPTDGKMRAAKYRTGWQPYSVKIGDQYYAYSRLEPLGMLLGLAADYSEIAGQIQEGEREKLASAITMAISKNVTSKTFLKGLSEAIEAFQDPDRYGPRYVQRFAGTVVPTGVAQIERTMSPEMSAVNSIMDQIKSRIPGYSDDLPPRRNLWGEPIVLDGGLGPDIISPIYTSKKVSSPIDEEILRLKSSVSMPRETQPIMGGSVRLDPKEYDRLIMLMNETPLQSTGLTLKKSMNQLVKSPEYRQANDDQKDMMIRATLQEARELARMQLYQESPTIQRIVSYQLKMRQEAVQ